MENGNLVQPWLSAPLQPTSWEETCPYRVTRGAWDPTNSDRLDVLQEIVGYPQTKPLTSEEKDLVWKFRFYLSTQKKVGP